MKNHSMAPIFYSWLKVSSVYTRENLSTPKAQTLGIQHAMICTYVGRHGGDDGGPDGAGNEPDGVGDALHDPRVSAPGINN